MPINDPQTVIETVRKLYPIVQPLAEKGVVFSGLDTDISGFCMAVDSRAINAIAVLLGMDPSAVRHILDDHGLGED